MLVIGCPLLTAGDLWIILKEQLQLGVVGGVEVTPREVHWIQAGDLV